MRFRHYRSLTDVADLWSRAPRATGDSRRLYQDLVAAVCDGAFFDEGLAVRPHALLRAMDPEEQSYAPFAKRAEIQPDGSIKAVPNERLPDFQTVYDRRMLHAYLGGCRDISEALASDHEAFFDWVKNTDPSRHGVAVRRLFDHVSISARAFRAWCRASHRAMPDCVEDWPDSLPRDPNHWGPASLPDTDLITLCEAVTWLTTGRARPAPVLRRLMDQHHGRRWPRGLWHELEEDAGKLVSALRREDLVAYGQIEGGPHAAIPRSYFDSDVFAEFVLDLIAADPQAWSRGTYPDGLPTYRGVRFRRSELWSAMNEAVRAPDHDVGRGPRGSIAAGTRCRQWLMTLMLTGPPEAPKADYMRQACLMFGVSKRQFTNAWAQARQETGNAAWGRAGRRRTTAVGN